MHVSPRTQVIIGDALNFDSLLKAMKDVDVAYYLIHSMASKGDFTKMDREAAMNFGEAASLSGVKRIIYLGGLGSVRGDLSNHLKSRHEVGDYLRESAKGVQVIEFRSSVVLGAGGLSFEMIRALCEKLPVMFTPKWVSTLLQPIAISNLLEYLQQALDAPIEGNPIFEIGGRDQVSYADLMKEYCKQRGLKRVMIPVPFLSPYLSSLWLGLVTPLYSQIGRKLVDSAICPTVVTDPSASEYFSVNPLGYSDAIKEAIRQEDQDYQEPRWIDSFSEIFAAKDWKGVRFGNRFIDSRTVVLSVPPSKAFAPIRRIGGETGYYYGKVLWSLRGAVDSLFGGAGFRRGRRDPENVEVGDIIDSWRVEAYEPDRRLLLRSEMKLPGRAWLEFDVEGKEGYSTLRQTAIFDPVGFSGQLYWYSLYPFHRMIFAGMLRGIANAAILENKLSTVPNKPQSNAVQDQRIHSRYQGPPLKIVIAGGTGLIGSDLASFFSSGGHHVSKLVRTKPSAANEIFWNPAKGEIDLQLLEGVDAVINLAGENLAEGRWTKAKKERIKQSRITATETLAKALSQLKVPPRVLINSSAVGFYGSHGSQIVDEDSPPGDDFLADVCEEWEKAALPAKENGIRVVNLRLGVVLTPKGGALQKLLTTFKFGFGNYFGSGDQWISWITIDGVRAIVHFLITESNLQGPVNAVTPNPVTNRELVQTIGRVLNRSVIFPVPASLLRFALGEMADAMLMSSIKAYPSRLVKAEYQFLYPTLEGALAHLLQKESSQ